MLDIIRLQRLLSPVLISLIMKQQLSLLEQRRGTYTKPIDMIVQVPKPGLINMMSIVGMPVP